MNRSKRLSAVSSDRKISDTFINHENQDGVTQLFAAVNVMLPPYFNSVDKHTLISSSRGMILLAPRRMQQLLQSIAHHVSKRPSVLATGYPNHLS